MCLVLLCCLFSLALIVSCVSPHTFARSHHLFRVCFFALSFALLLNADQRLHLHVSHRMRQLGADNVDIRAVGGGQWEMKLKKGAVIHIPKAKKFDRLVAGQVPDGWDALRYVAVMSACSTASVLT